MPWLRRYRLNDGPVYDGIEDEDTGTPTSRPRASLPAMHAAWLR